MKSVVELEIDAPRDEVAAALRGFGPLGIFAILAILAANAFAAPLGALLALAWAYRSRTPWREIGYSRPKSWAATIAIGIVFGVAFKLVMKSVVMPLLGAPPLNATYGFLVGNVPALAGMLLAVTLRGGFGEETLFRGYMFERLGKLLGNGIGAKIFMVVATTALFALLHYDQGLPGMEQAAFTGLAFGAIFAVTRRIWIPMIAHAAFDVTAVAIIYWDLESEFAQVFFN